MQGPGANEVVDKFLQQLGTSRIFEIILNKLEITPSSSTSSSGAEHPVFVNPPDLISSAIYVLVNLAAGPPRNRSLILSEKTLLRALLACYQHTDPAVKLPAILTISNLTWIDDGADRERVHRTCHVLRDLGFAEAIERLKHDPVADIRFKAEQAWRSLIDGEAGSRYAGSLGGNIGAFGVAPAGLQAHPASAGSGGSGPGSASGGGGDFSEMRASMFGQSRR